VNIKFKPSQHLFTAAQFTFDNMKSYYERYSVDWDVQQIADKTIGLQNFDIVVDDTHHKDALNKERIVGVFRLQYLEDYCFLRDVQIQSSFQNRGIGQKVLDEAKRLALQSNLGTNLGTIKLKVFKISPAVALYKRNGFEVESEDDRFFHMVAKVSKPST
jgi:ribosomal protein S18 acetylase RimI-like enzyme